MKNHQNYGHTHRWRKIRNAGTASARTGHIKIVVRRLGKGVFEKHFSRWFAGKKNNGAKRYRSAPK